MDKEAQKKLARALGAGGYGIVAILTVPYVRY